MKIALLAALALGVANVFSVLMVQAEARGRPVVAGLTEVGFWVANIGKCSFREPLHAGCKRRR